MNSSPAAPARHEGRVAASLVLALGNWIVVVCAAVLLSLLQNTTPPMLREFSAFWLVVLGPAVVPLMTLAFAARDRSRGRRWQARCAIALAVLATAILWGAPLLLLTASD